LALCQIIFLFIYLIIDFLQKIDNFIHADVSKGLMVQYFLFKAPFVMVQMLPPATLIAIIIMFSLMKKKNEIVAIKACGLNIFRVAQPVIIASIFIGIALFFFYELVVPYTSSRSNEIWKIDVEKRDPGLYYGSNQIWYRGPDSIYWIRHFDNKRNIMERPTFYFFDKTFRLIKKIDGKRGFWEEGRWRIEQGIVQEAISEEEYALKKFDTLFLDLPETPETFVKSMKKPEEMSYWQLERYAKRVHAEGYDNTQYLVDRNIKAAFPVIILIMVLIGIAISLLHKGDKIPVVVSIGVGICFLFMIAFGFSRSLGLAGVLPPLIAAWITNLIFFFIGIYLMLHIER
jgi:lipopolysaccharide export system permease protein